MSKYVSASEAVSYVKSKDRVFVHGQAATPHILLQALVDRAPELRDVEILSLHTEGGAPYAAPDLARSFICNAFYIGENLEYALAEGRADYNPVSLNEVPYLFRRRILPLDVALVHVSPPDAHGFCTLGPAVDVTLSAVESARYVVAQINPQMPRVHGDGIIHVSRFDALVEVDVPLPVHTYEAQHPATRAIARHVAELVDHGATLHLGIGEISNAVLTELKNHKDLGLHTEMFSDGVIDLVEQGVLTGKHKRYEPGKIIAAYVLGSKRVYDFIDDNPSVELLDIALTNDPNIIRQNPKVTSICTAIEVDLTGQICSDSQGNRAVMGSGGQFEFNLGAQLAEEGRPIVALPSVNDNGESAIVPWLRQGASVGTPRGHVHYVVTEHGVAYLHGKTLRQRARALIEIAHPAHRVALEEQAHQLYHLAPQA